MLDASDEILASKWKWTQLCGIDPSESARLCICVKIRLHTMYMLSHASDNKSTLHKYHRAFPQFLIWQT